MTSSEAMISDCPGAVSGMIVEQFLTWTQTASLEARVKATAALARAFLVSEIDDHDREALEATLTVLLDDPAPEIAAAIAKVMAPSRAAPRHLILALADGPPEVAEIVLEQSPILIEAELVDFLANGTPSGQVAIASRQWLSPGVSAALAEVGELGACITLANNPTASIPVYSLLRLCERFGSDIDLQDALLQRAYLPIEVRHSLLTEISASQATMSLSQTGLGGDRAQVIAAEAKDKTTVQIAAAASTEDLQRLVEHLRTTGQLTTALLLRAVTLGDVRFLAESLALLTGLSRSRVEGLIEEGREGACAALLAKAGLPQRVFPAFIAALDVQRELAAEYGFRNPYYADDHRFAARVIERVLTKCRENAIASEDDLILLLRRYATEAARDAARAIVAEIQKRPPLLLPAPEQVDADELILVADDQEVQAPDSELVEIEWEDEIRVEPPMHVEEYSVAFPVYPEARAA